jgi:hypothetical protein
MPRWRRVLNTIAGLAILAGLGYCTYRYAAVEDRVRAACSEVLPGMTLAEVKALAAAKALDATAIYKDLSYVVAPETLGDDFRCTVSWQAGVVASSKYQGPPGETS